MNVYIHNEMIVVSHMDLTESEIEDMVRMRMDFFLKKPIPQWEREWRTQLSINHDHLSREQATDRIAEVVSIVEDKFPEYIRRLEASWKESSEGDDEDRVNLSFYLDRATLNL